MKRNKKQIYYADHEIDELKNARQLVIFGAGNVARLILHCLLREPYNLPIACCLVSDRTGNPRQIEGVPVIDYNEAGRRLAPDAVILVAVVEKYLDAIEADLRRCGFDRIMPLTYENDLWSFLRGNCYRRERLLEKRPYLTLEEELEKAGSEKGRTVGIYRACCSADKALREDISRYDWEIPIQVGAALTSQRLGVICDNTGDHISEKNKQYCELTALYWIWKNDCSDYVGLCHYRRHFELDRDRLRKLGNSDIDVVLTIPIMDYPSVEKVYRRDHVGGDWDVMLDAVRHICPEYMPTVLAMQKGRYYYAYNMFIMRREILERYCAWLFPLLFYCEERCGEKEDVYQNRYVGFLAEHLMSAYFQHHENDYKIVHAKKHFIG